MDGRAGTISTLSLGKILLMEERFILSFNGFSAKTLAHPSCKITVPVVRMAILKGSNSTTLALILLSVLSVAGGSLEQVPNI